MKYLFLIFLFIVTIYPTLQKLGENWMSKLSDDTKIIFINIPGSHDSAANEVVDYAESFAKTQSATISQLLEFGVRKFDIRVALIDLTEDEEDQDLNLGTCHGMFDCYFTDEFGVTKILTLKHILLDIKNFLEKNPTETVIIWTQSERGVIYENIKRAVELFEKIVGNIFVKYDKKLKLGDVKRKNYFYCI